MLNDAKCFDKIYIACGYTDLRLGIDGLASKITLEFGMKPFCPRVLFLFCGRKSDRIKGLVWEEDGFLPLAYNIFNWFKRLVLPNKMKKHTIDTIRIKLLKIAVKVVRSARYLTFKLCSSCPYKDEFYKTLENIQHLQPMFE